MNMTRFNLSTVKIKLLRIIGIWSGHKLEKITSFNSFVNYMYEPVDAAAIGIGRLLFGK